MSRVTLEFTEIIGTISRRYTCDTCTPNYLKTEAGGFLDPSQGKHNEVGEGQHWQSKGKRNDPKDKASLPFCNSSFGQPFSGSPPCLLLTSCWLSLTHGLDGAHTDSYSVFERTFYKNQCWIFYFSYPHPWGKGNRGTEQSSY